MSGWGAVAFWALPLLSLAVVSAGFWFAGRVRARRTVRVACEVETAAHVAELVPAQRGASQ